LTCSAAGAGTCILFHSAIKPMHSYANTPCGVAP
jgi:hypothetical protein